MRRTLQTHRRLALALVSLLPGFAPLHAGALGLFEHHQEVGHPKHPGSASYDDATRTYRIRGGGANMWFAQDDFHFVWLRVSGDVQLTADITWPTPGGNAHRKAALLLRQDLDPDSAYADAVLHGDGLTSLQGRDAKGAPTREVQSVLTGARTLRLERCGDVIAIAVARPGEPLSPGGGSFHIPFKDPVYLGLGVCAHDDETTEEAVFSQVRLEQPEHRLSEKPVLESTLEIIDVASRDRKAVYVGREHFEAPNWSRDGQHFLINRAGRLGRVPRDGGVPEWIDTGSAVKCNNDHGYSPDGSWLALSDQSETGQSMIYVVPAAGGTPRKITPRSPSYWHGWSPDGQTLAYCAQRDGNYDIYTIPVTGGPERRLTSAPGLDDGPDYSPDGQWIYFNSERSGHMQIWRMHPDGTQQEPVTRGPANDWFPHPSPDGRWIALLSYAPEVQGHPANLPVQLRLLPTGGGEPQLLAHVFGGQGTLNVPSWSPDSRRLAFVSYRLLHH